MKYLKYSLLIFFVLCFGTATVQSAAILNIPAGTSGEYRVFFQDSLTIYGEGFAFKVLEPINFPGYTSDAYKYKINVYFCQPHYSFDNSPVVMYVRVLSKNGYSVEKSLESDMEDFKRRHTVEFDDLKMNDLKYSFAAKKYLIDNKDIDYLCYIDPDSSSPLYVIFVLSGPKEICENYLHDFQKLVQSFEWMTGKVDIK